TRRWRAFTFAGQPGLKVDVFVDGLRGLDTVAYLYKVSATTGRPYGRAIVSNDDTRQATWKLRTNARPNPYSSSIISFVLREQRTYALLATTYQQAGRGTAEVQVKATVPPPPAHCAASLTLAVSSGAAADFANLQE